MDRTTELQVVSLTYTASGKIDPAAAFFADHPTPEEIEGATDYEAFKAIKLRCCAAVGLFTNLYDIRGMHESDDPDFPLLVDAFIPCIHPPIVDYVELQCALGQMALNKSREKTVTSFPALTKKDKLLEYYSWMLHGRKDETFPLREPQHDHVTSKFAGDPHDFLPSSTSIRGLCANCGAPDAKSRCSGCHIAQESETVFGIYYCDQTCRATHWKEHKAACKDVRALRRAASTFVELYHLFLREAWCTDTPEVSVSQHGLTIVRYTVDHDNRRRAFLGLPISRRFLSERFSDDHQALAIFCNSRCDDVLRSGWPLFDHVMRCKSNL